MNVSQLNRTHKCISMSKLDYWELTWVCHSRQTKRYLKKVKHRAERRLRRVEILPA